MSQDPRHPRSSYGARYPFNRCTTTESGHELHWDDTPGRERVRIAHRSGSYTEWSPDGRRVDMTVGHLVQYVKGGITTTADKNCDVKYGGSVRTSVSGDSHSEVAGTSSQAVSGSVLSGVGGDSVSAVGGDVVMGATGKMALKVGAGVEVKGDTQATMKVGDVLTVEAGSMIRLKVGGSTIEMTSGGIVARADRIDLNP